MKQINDNFSSAVKFMIGESVDYNGSIHSIRALMIIDRMREQNAKYLEKIVNKPQADLYIEEVTDMINSTDFKSVTRYFRNTNETPITLYNGEVVLKVLYEMAMLANNMTNKWED